VSTRTYGQFCGFARALEIIGERWALLIIRDLLVAPKRFTDLERGLGGVPSNILTVRLKELELAGIVRRRALPRPERGVVYELTAYGRELDDIVLRIGAWGAKSLDEPRPGETITVDSLVMALRSTFQPAAARAFQAGYELHLGPIVLHADVRNGKLEASAGPLEKPDLIIESGSAIKELLTGERTPAQALAAGSVHLRGPRKLLDRFVEIFHIDQRPAA
jgi:DNA-binding HxlR family transcriptional regulator